MSWWQGNRAVLDFTPHFERWQFKIRLSLFFITIQNLRGGWEAQRYVKWQQKQTPVRCSGQYIHATPMAPALIVLCSQKGQKWRGRSSTRYVNATPSWISSAHMPKGSIFKQFCTKDTHAPALNKVVLDMVNPLYTIRHFLDFSQCDYQLWVLEQAKHRRQHAHLSVKDWKKQIHCLNKTFRVSPLECLAAQIFSLHIN